jgi:hypothetical protein
MLLSRGCCDGFERDRYRIDGDFNPPCSFVTLAMKLAVLDATERDRELVAALCVRDRRWLRMYSATRKGELVAARKADASCWEAAA